MAEQINEPIALKVLLASPCHPDGRLIVRYDTDPPNMLRCSVCGRVWLLGVCLPLSEVMLYTTQQALADPPA